MGAAICGGVAAYVRTIRRCPLEKRRRRIVGAHLGTWYGVRWTCCGCGDSWMDGEIAERPFRRGWRKEAIGRAKASWSSAMNWPAYRAFVEQEVREELGASRG